VIDTHCHLLPGLDDGPADEPGAVELARQLFAVGVRFVLCTPHWSRLFPTTAAAAREALVALRSALFAAEVPLQLGLAAELSPATAVSASAEELAKRSVGGFLLVELEPDTPAAYLQTLLERLGEEGLRPILAHPERCRSVRDQPRLLEEARSAGALVQVVAPSLTGSWGGDVQAAARRLLDRGLVDLLGSDAHRARRRGAHLGRAAALVAERLGADVLHELTERGPARVVGRSPQPA
jgi:protein-tyrosine phosphatase